MNASTRHTCLVRVTVAHNAMTKTFAIFSEDLPGLFLSGKDLSVLLDDVPNIIKGLYALDFQMNVDVTPATVPQLEQAASHQQFNPIPQQYVVAKQLAA